MKNWPPNNAMEPTGAGVCARAGGSSWNPVGPRGMDLEAWVAPRR